MGVERRHSPALMPEEWHRWFSVQAGWTQPTRMWLYQQAGLAQARDILEGGCGTGVITTELVRQYSGRPRQLVGLDLDVDKLTFAHDRRQVGSSGDSVSYVQGDAHALPYPDGSFDVVVCHYLLLWLVTLR